MSICTYHLGKAGREKKTIARRLSQGRRLREQIQHFFFFISFPIYLLQCADLAQPEMRALCELVGTLNVWVPINTPINQSPTLCMHCVCVSQCVCVCVACLWRCVSHATLMLMHEFVYVRIRQRSPWRSQVLKSMKSILANWKRLIN